MPETPNTDSINQEQYDQYTSGWLALLNSGSSETLEQAFQAPNGERTNFCTFSIDQILALVSAAGAYLIKARFLLMPDATGQARFSIALFTVDADDNLLTAYYIPTEAAATATQVVAAPTEPGTRIPRAQALSWLTAWVDASALTTAEFTTPHGPLHGFNFEVSTFRDPLAGASPYAGKSLFLNCGLSTATEAMLSALVVYVGLTGSRTQGTLAGIPGGEDVFYDGGAPCPPAI